MMFFIDFEASSLSPTSVPIEIAWVEAASGGGEAHLILPEAAWADWSLRSEKIHHITRPMLWMQGAPAADVARRAHDVLRGATVVSDNPISDGRWLSVLLEVIGAPVAVPVISFNAVIADEIKRMACLITAKADTPQYWRQHRLVMDEAQVLVCDVIDVYQREHRPRHRALPDAQQLRLAWKTAQTAIDRRLALG